MQDLGCDDILELLLRFMITCMSVCVLFIFFFLHSCGTRVLRGQIQQKAFEVSICANFCDPEKSFHPFNLIFMKFKVEVGSSWVVFRLNLKETETNSMK